MALENNYAIIAWSYKHRDEIWNLAAHQNKNKPVVFTISQISPYFDSLLKEKECAGILIDDVDIFLKHILRIETSIKAFSITTDNN